MRIGRGYKIRAAGLVAALALAAALVPEADAFEPAYSGALLTCGPPPAADGESLDAVSAGFNLAPGVGMEKKWMDMPLKTRITARDANNSKISYWHDIPTFPEGEADNPDNMLVNFVAEIPEGSNAKMEIIKESESNPIKFDTKPIMIDGATAYRRPRYKAYGPYPFTYGAIPQTWENSEEPDPITNIPGDNDPIDAFDIGSVVPEVGQVYEAKVLGALGVIDDGETDWKIMVINAADPNATAYNSVWDIPEELRDQIFTYYRDGDLAERGGEQSVFYPRMDSAYDPGQNWQDADVAMQHIKHTRQEYLDMVADCEKVAALEFWYAGCPEAEAEAVNEVAAESD